MICTGSKKNSTVSVVHSAYAECIAKRHALFLVRGLGLFTRVHVP
jgi:hypothetical protein